MPRPILIRSARQLITLHGPPPPRRGANLRELGIITDGALLIRDGIIEEVGTSRRVEALAGARDADEISAAGRLVMPGFVDCNAHVVSGIPKASETPLNEAWTAIEQTPSRVLESQGLLVLEDFVRCGTTTVEAKSGFGMSERNEFKILRAHAGLSQRTSMLASTFMAARWRTEAAEAETLDHMRTKTLPAIRAKRRAEFACIDAQYFSQEQVRHYLRTAKQLGFETKLQADPRAYAGAIADAVRLGTASVDGLIGASEPEIELLANSNTVATLLPGLAFFAGDERYPEARALIDGGAAVALATNRNPYTSPCHNMQMILTLACRRMGMSIAEAISAATINGAFSMRRPDAGSLESGKAANLIFLSISDHRELPFHFGVNLVEMTMRKGQVIYQRSGVRWPETQ